MNNQCDLLKTKKIERESIENVSVEYLDAVEAEFLNSLINDSQLKYCDFRNSAFRNCLITGVDFSGSDLSYSLFDSGTISKTKLGRIHQSKFNGVVFIETSLVDLDGFDSANFQKSIFFNCSMLCAQKEKLLSEGNIIRSLVAEKQLEKTEALKKPQEAPKKTETKAAIDNRFGSLELDRKAAL